MVPLNEDAPEAFMDHLKILRCMVLSYSELVFRDRGKWAPNDICEDAACS